MVPACHGSEDCSLNFVPPVDHLVVAETQHNVVECTEIRIAPPIGFKAHGIDVIRGTIHFNDEPPSDEKVDPHPVDPDLTLKWNAKSRESYPCNGFGAALANTIRQL